MAKKKLKPLAERQKTIKFWKKKADAKFSEVEREKAGQCQICGKEAGTRADGKQVTGLDLHHMIHRARVKHRYVSDNSIVLCTNCHGSHPNFRNRACSAHGSLDAQEVFYAKMRERYPEKMEYFKKYSMDKTDNDENGHVRKYGYEFYKEIYESL